MEQAIAILFPLLSGALVIYGFNRLDNSAYQVKGVVGPYFAALALLFGLFASLTAGDVWQRVSKANAQITSEANAMRTILRITQAMEKSDLHVNELLHGYIERESSIEKTINNTGKVDIQSTPEIEGLFKIAVNPANFTNAVVQSEFIKALVQLRSARFERLEANKAHLAVYKLVILALFGVLTQIAIALCHPANYRALLCSVMLFSIAFSCAMGFITMFENNEIFSSLLNLNQFNDLN